MRVAVYVPGSAPDRYRRRGEAQCLRQGHEFVGFVTTPAAAAAAVSTGVADKVAADPDHLPDLVPWLLVLPRPRVNRAIAGIGVASTAVWDALREHPLRAGVTVAAGLVGAGLLVALPLLLGPDGPDQARVAPSPSAASSPATSPPAPPPLLEPGLPDPTPPTAGQQIPPGPLGAGGGLPESPTVGPGRQEATTAPAPPTHSPSPPPEPVPSPEPSPSAAPAAPPDADDCLIRLEVLGIRVSVCL